MNNDTLKQNTIAALYAFIGQRSGFEFANYGDVQAFRAEQRSIGKDLAHARTLLRAVELSSITGQQLVDAARGAFSGRLTIKTGSTQPHPTRKNAKLFVEGAGDAVEVDYCTGQYFPTEYRRAVAAVCASALWNHWRDGISIPALSACPDHAPGIKNVGDYIRKTARREFGRGIASRWFN